MTPEDRDLRDRMIRNEQNIQNYADNFRAFKADDFQSLKAEVHTMRGELNRKIDALHELILEFKDAAESRSSQISLIIAKWMGAGGALMIVGQILIDKFF